MTLPTFKLNYCFLISKWHSTLSSSWAAMTTTNKWFCMAFPLADTFGVNALHTWTKIVQDTSHSLIVLLDKFGIQLLILLKFPSVCPKPCFHATRNCRLLWKITCSTIWRHSRMQQPFTTFDHLKCSTQTMLPLLRYSLSQKLTRWVQNRQIVALQTLGFQMASTWPGSALINRLMLDISWGIARFTFRLCSSTFGKSIWSSIPN